VDLETTIEKGSRLSIAAACFSIYALGLKPRVRSVRKLVRKMNGSNHCWSFARFQGRAMKCRATME
jgi:hypothetical protein